MNIFYIVLCFIIGICIGSFINAVIYRLKNNITIFRDRSFCPKCKNKLAAKDLVPILSYFVLKGKCRYCTKKISMQYWIVELITGIMFVLVYLSVGDFFATKLFAYCFFSTVLLIIFLYDLKYYLILDRVTMPAIIISLTINLALFYKDGFANTLTNFWIAMLFGGLFFLLQFIITKAQGIGGGDVRLGILMGAILGWPNTVFAVILAYIMGFVFGMFFIIFLKGKLYSKIPLGPFLTLATFITLLYPNKIIKLAYLVFGPIIKIF